ncbi:MAG: hypothetical protein LIP04_00625 [Tannerellaceae bacterium]|nr:hypothetical protein [Tannerellaceae bacterium]
MKKACTYAILTLLALLITYGGAGVNLISYCCDECRSEGIEVIVVDKCCEIHDHHHADGHDHHHAANHMDDCTEHFCETDCCNLKRISFEWDHTTYPWQDIQPVICDLLPIDLPLSSILLAMGETAVSSVEEYSPPLIHCPRGYLSLLTTLLI